MTIIHSTIRASLIVQWITLIIGGLALTKKTNQTLNGILWMEMIVQFVEIIFYHWFQSAASNSSAIAKGLLDISWVRYTDWVFTTPVMLVSTALYFSWINNQQITGSTEKGTDSKKDPEMTSGTFGIINWLTSHRSSLLIMFLANLAMLAFGFLQEFGLLDIVWSSLLGFVALFISFGELGNSFVWDRPFDILSGSPQNQMIFWSMFGTWFMYGIAAMMPSVAKNVTYNILDLIAKNFYGLYLSGLILFS